MSSDTSKNDASASASNPQSGTPEVSLSDFFVAVPPGNLRVISQNSIRWREKPPKRPGGQEKEEQEPGRDLVFVDECKRHSADN